MNDQLAEQLEFLRTSLSQYETNESEAKQLATTLRVLLFHDTGSSHSLTKQLAIKDSIQFFESKAPKDAFAYWRLSGPGTLNVASNFVAQSPYAGLVAKSIVVDGRESSVRFLPLHLHPNYDDSDHARVAFTSWWDSEIFDDKQGSILRRRDAVLLAANKDGGAHVDRSIPQKYLNFKNKSLLPIDHNGQPLEFDTIPIYAAIAQIAYEAIEAIETFSAPLP